MSNLYEISDYLKFKKYISKSREVLRNEVDISEVYVEELYILDLKQFQDEERKIFKFRGKNKEEVGDKKKKKEEDIAKLKIVPITTENPIKNFLRFRARLDYDCDSSKCAKIYYKERFGWDYNKKKNLEKDTAQSFWSIYKTFIIINDIEKCKDNESIFYYKEYNKNELRIEYPMQDENRLRERWLLDKVWDNYKEVNDNKDLQKLSILCHTLGNMTLIPKSLNTIKWIANNKYKDCFYNIILDIVKNKIFLEDYKSELKCNPKISEEDLIQKFCWDIYLNVQLDKEKMETLNELPNLLLITEKNAKALMEKGKEEITKHKEKLQFCVKILNNIIWKINQRVYNEIEI